MNKIQTELMAKGARTDDARRAHFTAALCLTWPDGHREEFEAEVHGTLVWPPRGGKKGLATTRSSSRWLRRNLWRDDGRRKAWFAAKGQSLSHRARAFVMLAKACLPGK